jgi:hypothetical protein
MACYAYSVLNQWFSSVYIGAGSEPSVNQMAKQVVIASSVTPNDVINAILSQETNYDIPDVVQPTERKGGDNSKVIIIPEETAFRITGKIRGAYVTTRSDKELEDCLICNGGATCTLRKSLGDCFPCKPKVVVIQTAHGTTIMNSTHQCYKTLHLR